MLGWEADSACRLLMQVAVRGWGALGVLSGGGSRAHRGSRAHGRWQAAGQEPACACAARQPGRLRVTAACACKGVGTIWLEG